MPKKLTDKDFCEAAMLLSCEVAAIKAVASVESAGGGFLPDGKVKILFERHHFARLTKDVFNQSHPQISSRKAGGYYGNEKEYQRFNQAFRLNPTAAMMSCSWGKFQLMGFNYAVCGFSSIHAFVDAMKESEGEQLKGFCGFVETNNLDDELRRKDWAGFARGYNGKNYRINKYDEKMAIAYNRFKTQKIDCPKLLAEKPLADLTDEEINDTLNNINEFPADETLPTSTTEGNGFPETVSNPTEPVSPPETTDGQTETKEVRAPAKEHSTANSTKLTIAGFTVPAFAVGIVSAIKSAFENGYIDGKQVFDFVLRFLMENSHYIFYLIGLIIVGMILKKLYHQISFFLTMWINADKSKHDVEVIKQ